MLTAGDALAKTLAKSQKVIFWSKKNGFECFFLLTAVNALICIYNIVLDLEQVIDASKFARQINLSFLELGSGYWIASFTN